MICPRCGFGNPPDAERCGKCGAPFGGEATAATGPVATSRAGRSAGDTSSTPSSLIPSGKVLGGRYEILGQLGEGGMGAVYKARDRELDRLVALKVIRQELAGRPEILQRFKQELILAREITHRNVIRIFDLGESDGIKFISMDYVEGRDLKALLRERGKFSPDEAKGFIVQVCRALHAAHTEGVIHRDLKPQNIMVDKQGKVTVMDFGIARSMEAPGLTQTGMVVGTPEYMSPEQAKGELVDARSDLYALGIIFYELLTGKIPHSADTALAVLLKRTQERPRPPVDLEPTTPPSINRVVLKCLEIDPKLRYQSAHEILQDLEARTGTRPVVAVPRGWRELAVTYRKWGVAGIIVVLLAAVGGYVFREKIFLRPPPTLKPVTLLVADFENRTSEPVFDGTLEPMLEVALEGATFVNAYRRDAAHKVAAQLQAGATKLDESLARLVAVREGIPVVVAGSISHSEKDYVVLVMAVDANTGKSVVKEEAKARNKNDVLGVVGKLAAGIRKALGDTTPESAQIAAAETFTATSLEAAHEYAVAQNFQYEGKWDEAIRHYQKAVEFDPNLGRAYSGLGVMYANTGRLEESQNYYKVALSKIDRMSDREKYRTRGGYYLFAHNTDKAIEEYGELVRQYPSDSAGMANLALAYFWRHDITRALETGRRAVEISPLNVPQRNNVALYAMYAGDFDTAIREHQAVLKMNPSFVLAYVGTALSQLAEGRLAEATETWQRLEKLDYRGASMASSGLADLALYEGRVDDAIGLLEKAIAADFANKNPDAAALKLVTMAHAEILAGRAAQARLAVEKALISSKETAVQFWAARDYLDLGNEPKAIALAKQLGGQLEADPQAYGKLIEGETQLKHGKPQEAIKVFMDSEKISNTWMGHFDLARAYIEAGAFAEADSELETCLKRRGEATAAFLDEAPTFSLLPPLYYYLGRAQEGLKSSGAAESYKAFLDIKKNGEDPLIADARRRLAAVEAHGGAK